MMAEKMSMIIVLVDLDCRKCYNKMRKILCKLQDCERIQTISFDDKSKTITIVGPFDPQRLACKLRCKGGKVVKAIHIVDSVAGGCGKPDPQDMGNPPPAPAPVKKCKNKNKEKPLPAEQPQSPPPPAPMPPPDMMPPPSPAHHPPPPDREMSATVPQPQYVEGKPANARPSELDRPMSPPPKQRPADMAPPPCPVEEHPSLPPPHVKERPLRPPHLLPACPARPSEQPVEYVVPSPMVEIPSWPAPPVGPCGCPCCAPCYQGYYEGCRCACGRLCSYAVSVHPMPPPAGCGVYRGCRTFSDDDPAACSIM